MTDRDTVERFCKAVGVGHVSFERRSTANRKDVWKWYTVGHSSSQYVIALLWRGLGRRRRKRAKELLARSLKEQRRNRTPDSTAIELTKLVQSGQARKIRMSAGWTQAEVADYLNVTFSVVSHWETGRSVPSPHFGNLRKKYLALLKALK